MAASAESLTSRSASALIRHETGNHFGDNRGGSLSTIRLRAEPEAEQGIGPRELTAFRRIVARMTANLDRVER